MSLPEEDVAFLDVYAAGQRFSSRSGAVRKAVAMLRASQLERAYDEAFAEWEECEDAALWDLTSGDGIL
ncbi:MAG: ribbon-helix-helix domain-containing protein [Acidimicrobiales bacterium]